ncbi:golgi uridine diphosphate-N- acetylglucosamine transporter [Puttea exsequens]|nr:golgi uridine diphosphate-N- acetylglucosamine transporter [Puttea exsequens]
MYISDASSDSGFYPLGSAMGKGKKSKQAHKSPGIIPDMAPPTSNAAPRQRNPHPPSNGALTPPRTKEINVLEAKPPPQPDTPWSLAKVIGVTAAWIHMTVPPYLNWAVIMGLIFGGCCSNVFALETIIKEEPDSGLLITFVQFSITALLTWPTHFSVKQPPFFLRNRNVPLVRWIPNICMFFAVNLLNNFAFGYNISVPVHIILRSGGSIMTMLVGFAWGKRYTSVQVFSVAMLTVGVIMAAMADAQSKGKASSSTSFSFKAIDSELATGLAILFIAQLLSAIMGLYTQLTYAKYGSYWHENLFYSHFLSIPLFWPFFPSLWNQFKVLLDTTSIEVSNLLSQPTLLLPKAGTTVQQDQLPPISSVPTLLSIRIPKHIVTLSLNALTQYACIRGVNLLGARTSALGVSIALNVRKLVSLFASIWLFGNELPPGVMLGAAVVFGSAGIWAWEDQRLGRRVRNRDIDKGKKKA